MWLGVQLHLLALLMGLVEPNFRYRQYFTEQESLGN